MSPPFPLINSLSPFFFPKVPVNTPSMVFPMPGNFKLLLFVDFSTEKIPTPFLSLLWKLSFEVLLLRSSSLYLLITYWFSGEFQPFGLISDSKGSVIFKSECPVGVFSWKRSTNFHISSLLTRNLSTPLLFLFIFCIPSPVFIRLKSGRKILAPLKASSRISPCLVYLTTVES